MDSGSDSDVKIIEVEYSTHKAVKKARHGGPVVGPSTASAAFDNGTSRAQAASHAPQLPAGVRPPRRDALPGSKRNIAEPSASSAPKRIVAPAPADAIRSFLAQLKQPLLHLEDAFKKFGIASREDLDVLCELQDQWDLLHGYLIEKYNVTQLQWMVVKAGLTARAAKAP